MAEFKGIDNDRFCRERIKDLKTKAIYTFVDGVPHYVSRDGEPICPVGNPILANRIKAYRDISGV